MTDRITLTLHNAQQAHAAILRDVWPTLKSMLMAGHRMVLEVKQQKRSLKENALLHALLTQISRKMEWAGAKRDVETWKRLITAARCRARGEHVEMLPALDGNGVDIVFRRTSQLTRSECAELIEFVYAWATQAGIEFDEYVDQETGEVMA